MTTRYSRNQLYVHKSEQIILKSKKILLAGAGLGSTIAECALRLGFENICIIDNDSVEDSNLNRQNYNARRYRQKESRKHGNKVTCNQSRCPDQLQAGISGYGQH